MVASWKHQRTNPCHLLKKVIKDNYVNSLRAGTWLHSYAPCWAQSRCSVNICWLAGWLLPILYVISLDIHNTRWCNGCHGKTEGTDGPDAWSEWALVNAANMRGEGEEHVIWPALKWAVVVTERLLSDNSSLQVSCAWPLPGTLPGGFHVPVSPL